MPGKTITTRYPSYCADCGAAIPEGVQARYYGRGHLYGIGCHEQGDGPHVTSALAAATIAATEAYEGYVAEHYTTPAYAVMENAAGDLFYDPSKPTRVVGTMADLCGFVCISVNNRRNSGAPGKRLLTEFKHHATADGDGRRWRLGAYSLTHSGYDGSWSLGGYGADSVTGGTGNGALGAARAGGRAFVESMTAAGYEGMRVESQVD